MAGILYLQYPRADVPMPLPTSCTRGSICEKVEEVN